jgi:UDP-glucose 4-epimerase
MRTLVTGGCGFIGSAVVNRLLSRSCEVHIVDNVSRGRDHWTDAPRRPALHRADILHLEVLADIFDAVKPAAVIHLAAHHYIPYCEQHPFDAYHLNVTGTLNVVELCRQHDVRKFFLASTGDVYPPAFAPHRETDMVAPIYTYGHTKYLAEQICAKCFGAHHTSCGAMIGRLFNAAGPRETNPHLIPEVVRQIGAGRDVIEVGNLWPKRDFVDVDSMAAAIIDLTFGAEGLDVVNIGSGEVQEIGHVLELLRRHAGRGVRIVSVPERQRPNDRPYLCPDVTRLRRLLGRAAAPFGEETARGIFAELQSRTLIADAA